MQEGSLCGLQSVDRPHRHGSTNKVSTWNHHHHTHQNNQLGFANVSKAAALFPLEWYSITRCHGAIWRSSTLMTSSLAMLQIMILWALATYLIHYSYDIIVNVMSIVRVIHLWYLLLCIPKLVLEGQILPQWSHGIDIPSKWLDSMWFFIWVNVPSLPHFANGWSCLHCTMLLSQCKRCN